MALLLASSLGMSFGERVLYEGVTVHLAAGDRIALIGPNGAGKTTLLRCLSRSLEPTAGEISVPAHVRVSLHDQRPARGEELLHDYVAPDEIVALERQLRALETRMAAGDDAALEEYGEVRERFDALEGDVVEARTMAIVRGLGLEDRHLSQPLDSLSGGELTRASLARALASDPDVLLLDEPTNHLDLESIDWLVAHLNDFRGAIVVVSHDRWFIEGICTGIVEIANGSARRFNGSYSEYRAQQVLEALTHERYAEKAKGEIAKLERFVTRFSAGTRSRQAQSRAKTLEKLRAAMPSNNDHSQRKKVSFRLPAPPRCARDVLEVKGLDLAWPSDDGPVELASDISLALEAGERVALLGRNGAGKSTLLRCLAHAAGVPYVTLPEAFAGGELKSGYGVEARFVSQHDEELPEARSLVGAVQVVAPSLTGGEARSLLGIFGFSGDAAETPVADLSGGERRRAMFATALAGASNLLLLDEPTNHLDIEGREALEQALTSFDGAVIFISHDRTFIDTVATRTLLIQDRRVVRGPVSLLPDPVAAPDDTPRQARRMPGAGRSPQAKAAQQPANDAPGRKVRRPAREKVRETKPSERRPATVEREITRLESELAEVEQGMLNPEVYSSKEKSHDALTHIETLRRRIDRHYAELERSITAWGD